MDSAYAIKGLTRPRPAASRARAAAFRRGCRGPTPMPVIDLDSGLHWPDTIAAADALERSRAQVVNACNGWSVRCAGRRLAYVGSTRHRRLSASA